MLRAIHQTTGRPYTGTFAQMSFSEPANEKWVCPPERIVSWPDDDKSMSFRRSHKRIMSASGKKVDVVPHWFIPSKEERNISTRDDTTHERCEAVVEYALATKAVRLRTSKGNPDKFVEMDELPKMEIQHEYRSIQGEDLRRADVIADFPKMDATWGNGIVFEIQLSDMDKEERDERMRYWFNRMYSVAWINKEDFVLSDKEHPALATDVVDVIPYVSGQPYIDNIRERGIAVKWESINKMAERAEEARDQSIRMAEEAVRRNTSHHSDITEATRNIDSKISMVNAAAFYAQAEREKLIKATTDSEQIRQNIMEKIRQDVEKLIMPGVEQLMAKSGAEVAEKAVHAIMEGMMKEAARERERMDDALSKCKLFEEKFNRDTLPKMRCRFFDTCRHPMKRDGISVLCGCSWIPEPDDDKHAPIAQCGDKYTE